MQNNASLISLQVCCKQHADNWCEKKDEWRGERQGSLGQMRLHLVQGWGCQSLQATEPTTEPAMTPGDTAPLEEPDAASLGILGGADGRGAASESSTT